MKQDLIINCLKCSQKFSLVIQTGFICNNCKFLNPINLFSLDDINGLNYFNYLFLPYNLSVNLGILETNFLSIMQLYHPDKYASKAVVEQFNSLQHTNYLNVAYNTMLNFMLLFPYYFKLNTSIELITENDTTNNLIAIEFLDIYEEMSCLENNKQKNVFIDKLQNNFLGIKNNIINVNITKIDEIKNLFVKLKYLDTIILKANKLNFIN